MSNADPCECDWLGRAAAEPSIPVVHDPNLNEYHLVHDGPNGRAKLVLRYCPFCGGAAPKSRRAALFYPLTDDELARLRKLTDSLKTVADVLAAFGTPDQNVDLAAGIRRSASATSPPTSEHGRALRYAGLSETADVQVVEGADGRVRFAFSGKPISVARSPDPAERERS